MSDPSTERLTRVQEQFALAPQREFTPGSALYARLCPLVAADPDLVRLAATAQPGQPTAVFFFGAVHYLLAQQPDNPLAAYYPSLTSSPRSDSPGPALRAFCLAHADAIRHLLQTRRVQTNEVQRCVALLPAFGLVAALGGGRPLALVEIGASVGLNLLWDRYHYAYSDGQQVGDSAAAVRLECEVRGPHAPPVPQTFPAIASRVGLDLNPIDVRDPDAVAWLRALIWPEHAARRARLTTALALAAADPPPVLAGDALELLPAVLAAAPPDTTLCVWHSFTLNQFAPDARAALAALLGEVAATRPLYRLGMEFIWGDPSQVRLSQWAAGVEQERVLAHCNPHGHWLEWLEEQA